MIRHFGAGGRSTDSPEMTDDTLGSSKPWWRRWDGMPGDLRASDFATPAVRDPRAAATIVVARTHRYADSLRPYNVYLDGDPVALLQDDSEVRITVDPGRHRVKLTIGSLWSSNELELALPPNRICRLTCTAPWAGLTLLTSAFRRHRYIRLEVEGEPTA